MTEVLGSWGKVGTLAGMSSEGSSLRRSVERLLAHPAAAFLLALLFLTAYRPRAFAPDATGIYVTQARAFARGSLSLPGPEHDSSTYEGKVYCAFPPLPPLLMVPLVWLFGDLINPSIWLSLLAAAATGFVVFQLMTRRLGHDRVVSMWLVLAFMFGTGYWMTAARSNGVWFLAQTVAGFFCFATLHEGLGRARPWLMGFLLGCAFLCRQLTIAYAPFLAAILWTSGEAALPKRFARLFALGLGLGVPVAGQLLFNALRFSGPLDTGYDYMSGVQASDHGLFSPAYLVRNLIWTYVNGPHFTFRDDGRAVMDVMGTSLTFASPFVFLSVRAQMDRLRLLGAWASVLAISVTQLFYHNNGFAQTNCSRFTLDFLPILLVLVASAWSRWPPALARGAIAYAVVLNTFALVFAPRVL